MLKRPLYIPVAVLLAGGLLFFGQARLANDQLPGVDADDASVDAVFGSGGPWSQNCDDTGVACSYYRPDCANQTNGTLCSTVTLFTASAHNWAR